MFTETVTQITPDWMLDDKLGSFSSCGSHAPPFKAEGGFWVSLLVRETKEFRCEYYAGGAELGALFEEDLKRDRKER